MDIGAYAANLLSVEPITDGQSNFSLEEEWTRYFRRQNLLSQVVLGKMNPDDLLDCLGDDGHDVDEYLSGVEWSLQPFL